MEPCLFINKNIQYDNLNIKIDGNLISSRLLSRPVVLKVVDIDPQGSIGPFKGLINSHGVEWGSLYGP